MSIELTQEFFAKIAGWEAMKRARAYVEMGQVLSAAWNPPLLRGVVQDGSTSFRGGLLIKSPTNVENVCHCRPSQEWGTICAHSIAVGLEYIKPKSVSPTATEPRSPGVGPGKAAAPVSPKKVSRLRQDAAGEPLRLRIILPPNLDQAGTRGKVMVCLEGQWAGGSGPLNSLPRETAFALSAQDAAILEHLETLAGGETPAMMLLDINDFVGVLPLLVNHPGVSLGKRSAIQVSAEALPVGIRAELETDGSIMLSASTELKGAVLGKSWVLQGGRLHKVALPAEYWGLFQQPLRVLRKDVPDFLHRIWPEINRGEAAQANFKIEDFEVTPHTPRFLLHLAGGLARLSARLQCAYPGYVTTVGSSEGGATAWMPHPECPTRYYVRDSNAERAALWMLTGAGFSPADGQGQLQLLGQDAVLAFFARVYPQLQKNWQVTLEERLERSTQQNLEWLQPQFQIISSGVEWFELKVNYGHSGTEPIGAAEIQRLLLAGQNHTRLRNGKIALIDTGAVEELQEVLLDCAPQQQSGAYRIANAQSAFLASSLREHAWTATAPADWKERARQQSGEENLVCPSLGALEDVLRPYQKQGVAWLHFLRRHNFGGILADEMGLGKTLQALAFLQTVRRDNMPQRQPSLVVCPTSLVPNWVAEANRFVPDLKVVALHGAGRHRIFADVPGADLVVTSYAVLRRDAERYREWQFDTVILDEAQHIKNRQTQNAQAVKSVRSEHRLVLTGTPLENSVSDLWSIYDFLMPGYLGSAADFRERYEIPIVRHRDVASQARLSRRLRPFLLRRLKREVAKDLPEKIEQVAFCEMTESQGALYAQVLEASRKEILELGPSGMARSRMVVLTALLRLRQICCDPRLLKLEEVEVSSAKMELFAELLEEVLDGGHRVLVFSQFVTMLGLIREKLTAEEIPYCYLDGATADRAAVIGEFQSRPEIPVFLISLKAGGVGLNLTGADTVIHFDPWWNPAVEDQATDRAHRIGQSRIVTSYKLITRDTVEEKILHLQNRKRELFQVALAGEEAFADALSWDEIQELISI